jgi:hypothetical protein
MSSIATSHVFHHDQVAGGVMVAARIAWVSARFWPDHVAFSSTPAASYSVIWTGSNRG